MPGVAAAGLTSRTLGPLMYAGLNYSRPALAPDAITRTPWASNSAVCQLMMTADADDSKRTNNYRAAPVQLFTLEYSPEFLRVLTRAIYFYWKLPEVVKIRKLEAIQRWSAICCV